MNAESTEQEALRRASPRRRPAGYSGLKRRARKLKRQIWALSLALKDPQTPWTARIIIGCTVAYAVSPIDLIPDFIPILGQLDDLVILPGLIVLALRLIPRDVMARCRREAWRHLAAGDRVKTPAATVASIIFVAVWALWILGVIRKALIW
jgi:uncharacterized membrane protein YkvA (DUF1232 family)